MANKTDLNLILFHAKLRIKIYVPIINVTLKFECTVVSGIILRAKFFYPHCHVSIFKWESIAYNCYTIDYNCSVSKLYAEIKNAPDI